MSGGRHRHKVYILVDEAGLYLDAFLSYSEAVVNCTSSRWRIITVPEREVY